MALKGRRYERVGTGPVAILRETSRHAFFVAASVKQSLCKDSPTLTFHGCGLILGRGYWVELVFNFF